MKELINRRNPFFYRALFVVSSVSVIPDGDEGVKRAWEKVAYSPAPFVREVYRLCDLGPSTGSYCKEREGGRKQQCCVP